MECNTYSLGAILRYQMYEDYQKQPKNKEYSQSIVTEILRFQTLFLMGIRPVCVFDTSDPLDVQILIPHKVSFPPYPYILLQTYTHFLAVRYQDNHQKYQKYLQQNNHLKTSTTSSPIASSSSSDTIELLENRSIILYDLAVFTDHAAQTYGQFYHLKTREFSNPSDSFSFVVTDDDPLTGELYGYYKQMKEALQSTLKFYQDAGEVFIF